MSISGSGKFRQIYVDDFDRTSSFSSSGRSGVYRPQQVSGTTGTVNYEPGSGAEYMFQRGWTNRDPYGKPLAPTTTGGRNVKFGKADDLTAKENRSKLILLVLLIIVSLLLIALVIIIIVLFATGVFTTHQAIETITVSPVPTVFPPGGDPLVNRTFDVQMYIVDQANNMFDSPTSFEYQQAFAMLQNAVTSMVSQSTLRDLQPTVGVRSMRNDQSDLQVQFRLSIIIPSSSPINAPTIRNLLLSELRLLENQLNGSEIDRGRISVSMIT
ncbi:hypothetical protein FO519_008893 [Halicephalobus sp. NKZ332]|nr:hypothetical protein FO519_008893 [Halicephalobus sp. NKZ332]